MKSNSKAFKTILGLTMLFGCFGACVFSNSNNTKTSEVKAESDNSTRCGVEAEWEKWTSTNSLPANGHFYLTENVTIKNNFININSGDLYLDLNNFTITFASNINTSAITISNGSSLYLYDSVGGGKITRDSGCTLISRAVIVNDANSTFNMYGGTIEGFRRNLAYGGAVNVGEGKFYLHGGTIQDCMGNMGGAVYVAPYAIFEMSGGLITNCETKINTADSSVTVSNYGMGGGVHSAGNFIMTGGEISNCTAVSHAGGVYVSGTFSMTGGSISYNSTSYAGGGVTIVGGTGIFSGGEINNNTSSDAGSYARGGGGIAVLYGAECKISGDVDIHDNSVTRGGGGGIAIFSDSWVEMRGGIIRNNTSSGNGGGGVYIRCVDSKSSIFYMYDGKIYDNKTTNGNGGGVACYGGSSGGSIFYFAGGEIFNNTTSGNGGGIAAWNTYAKTYIEGTGYLYNNTSSSGNSGFEVSSSGQGSITSGRFSTSNTYNGTTNKVSNITFDKDGGTSGTISISSQKWNNDLPLIGIPSKEGHTFLGYFNDKNEQYYNADGTPFNKPTDGIKWDYVGDKTLFAHWSEETTVRCDVEAGWLEWTNEESLPLSGYFYLTEDVTITSNQITLDLGDLHLDLNGHKINFAYTGSNPQSAFILEDGCDFYLYDSSSEKSGLITTSTSKYLRAVNINDANSAFYMHGGTISNFKNTTVYGGAVIINGGLFEMYDGTITECSAINGGGVYTGSNSTFNFYGGTITNCTSKGTASETGNGGGIYGVSTSNILIDGGTITENNADRYGGGVFTTGSLLMKSGTISNCNAINFAGGGVMLDTSTSSFTMSGGTISNNEAPASGGGVRLGTGSTFTMKGGCITGNKATKDASENGNGGGVFVKEGSTFIMEGGTISENTAKRYGGGVNTYGTFSMSGGYITNNTSELKSGGGVAAMVSGASFTMTGGEISGNAAHENGGAVCSWSGATLTFDGGRIKANTAPNSSGIYRNTTSCPVTYTSGRFYTGNSYTPTLTSSTSEITFDKNGGEGGTESISSQKWGSNLPNINVPSLMGHTFLGYFNDLDEQYYNADGTPTSRDGDGVKWDYVGPVTLTAKWEINEYTVSYNANKPNSSSLDVTNLPEEETYEYNEQFALAESPTLKYFTFDGWYLDDECKNKLGNPGDEVINLTTEKETINLYANWVKKLDDFAQEFLDLTNGYCSGDKSFIDTLKASFKLLSSEDVEAFIDAPIMVGKGQTYEAEGYSSKVIEAKSRYYNIVSDPSFEIDPFLDGVNIQNTRGINANSINVFGITEEYTPQFIIVTLLSIAGGLSIAGYFLIKKKKIN